jgi:hypothetical protein
VRFLAMIFYAFIISRMRSTCPSTDHVSGIRRLQTRLLEISSVAVTFI